MSRLLTACLVCGSERLHYLFSIAGNRVVRCDDCHLLLTNPQPSDEDLARMRPDDVAVAHYFEERSRPDELLNLLDRYHGSNGRLLQVGCSGGEFLAAAAARGYHVTGCEESASECEKAQLNLRGFSGAEVIHGGVQDIPGEGIYDVCLLVDILGRTRNPRAMLEHVNRLLRLDGVVLVATVPVESKSGAFSRTKFRPDEFFYFRRSELESLLFDCHFRKIIVSDAGPLGASRMIHMARKAKPRDIPRLSIIVPVFNEEQTFAEAFDKLLGKKIDGLEIEIVVVESNSNDGTRDLVERYRDHPRVMVVLEDKPRGKGHAVREGLSHINGDFVIIQDADLEYDFEDYEALLEPLKRGRAAFVLGARHGGSAWKMRQFNDQPTVGAVLNLAHWFFTALINVGFNARLKDPFTMFKVFRSDCLYGLRLECNRFDFDWELVINFLLKGYRPLEIPVNYRSRSFTEGKKVSFFRDPLTWLVIFVKLRFRKFEPLREVERERRESPAQG